MKKLTLVFLLIFLGRFANAQENFPVFNDTAYHYISAEKMIVNNDGSFVVLGSNTQNFSTNSQGFLADKYDANGNKLWSRVFNVLPAGPFGFASSNEYYLFASDMIPAADSGYIIVGDSTVSGNYVGATIDVDILNVYKLDESGNTVWETIDYESMDSWDYGWNRFVNRSNTSSEYFVMSPDSVDRFSFTGDFLGQVANPGFFGTFQVSDQDSLVGVKYLSSTSCLAFSDSNGILGDTLSFLPKSNSVTNTILTTDSCWLVTSTIDTVAYTNAYIELDKFNYHGTPLWHKLYAANDLSLGYTTTIENNGYYYITGSDKTCMGIGSGGSACVGVSNVVIIKTDTLGNELGRIVIPGDTTRIDSVKSYYGSQSAIIGDTIYTLGTYQRLGIYINTVSPVYSAESLYSSAYVVWKQALSSFVPLQTGNINQPETVLIYPDPSGGRFTLQFSSAQNEASITVLNMLGKQVYRSKAMAPQTDIDLSDQPTGMYFVHIQAGAQNITKKVIVSR